MRITHTTALNITLLLALLLAAGTVSAQAPEKRCLVSGSYIKVYGDTEDDKRETCMRQGGDYTTYVPPRPNAQPNGPREGFKAMMGNRGSGVR